MMLSKLDRHGNGGTGGAKGGGGVEPGAGEEDAPVLSVAVRDAVVAVGRRGLHRAAEAAARVDDEWRLHRRVDRRCRSASTGAVTRRVVVSSPSSRKPKLLEGAASPGCRCPRSRRRRAWQAGSSGGKAQQRPRRGHRLVGAEVRAPGGRVGRGAQHLPEPAVEVPDVDASRRRRRHVRRRHAARRVDVARALNTTGFATIAFGVRHAGARQLGVGARRPSSTSDARDDVSVSGSRL